MLKGNTNEERIWNYLVGRGLTQAGAAGLMGNLYAESALNPKNLQNSFEKKLGHTDSSYTAAVDKGSYKNFVQDKAGYGLAQWTFWSRKQNMLNFARAAGKSIGDLEMQLDFLWQELSTGYKAVLTVLKTATSVRAASDSVLLNFERPANQSESVQIKRAGYGQTYYDKYAKPGKGGTAVSNSNLVTYRKDSPNKSKRQSSVIDCVIIHCMVAQWTAKQCCDFFANASTGAASNYTVGYDGSIGQPVDEAYRAWCSGGTDKDGNIIRVNGVSGADFDHRAISIEVASDTKHPYAVTDKAYNALIELLVDVCKRNNIKQLLWKGDKKLVGKYSEQNMGAHRWFSNKSCPGDYLYNRFGEIANTVNKRLGGSTTSKPTTPAPTKTVYYRVRKTWADAKSQKGAYKVLANAKACADKNPGYSVFDENGKAVYPVAATTFKPYLVKVTTDVLNIRKGPGTNYGTNGAIKNRGIYTIVEEASGAGAKVWGKLRSGAGWISLDYTKRV